MVHAFNMKGKYIAYDSESCAIYELDALSFDVLLEYIKKNGETPSARDFSDLSARTGYDIEEVEDCQRDFDQLIEQGSLFSQGQVVTLNDLYPTAPAIKAMCLHICHDCNLRCRYCFAGTGDFGTGHRSMLDVKTGKQAIDFLVAASKGRHNLDIDFFGGEPLMNWPVVVELTHYCEDMSQKSGKDIRLTITTNALLLDEEKTKFINDHMKNCVLSIDGRPSVHDHMRPGISGKGSYDAVSKRIKQFVAARTAADSKNYEHYIRGTFTKNNLDFSQDVIHLAENFGSRHISVEPVVAPDGAGYEITLEDLPQIEQEYENLAEYIYNSKQTDHPVDFFHFIMDMQSGPCAYKRLKGCGVGAEYCAVTPEGDIYPCHQFVGDTAYLMGNVADFSELLDDQGQLLAGKSAEDILDPKVHSLFIDRIMPKMGSCKECFARYHCGGGCAANNLHNTGSLDELYMLGCALAKKRLECSIWIQTMSNDN